MIFSTTTGFMRPLAHDALLHGRRFKLLGYTVGGGKFRTTPPGPVMLPRHVVERCRNRPVA